MNTPLPETTRSCYLTKQHVLDIPNLCRRTTICVGSTTFTTHLDVRKLDLETVGQEGVEPEDELVVTPEKAGHATNHPGGVDGHSLRKGSGVSQHTAGAGEVSDKEPSETDDQEREGENVKLW